jgi:hypothetical protein
MRIMNRVAMLQSAILLPLMMTLSTSTAQQSATTSKPDLDLSIIPTERLTGEPYALAGKRLVFTSWYHVRPGGYAWITDRGEAVSANRKAAIGPWGASYVRKPDTPQGVRLVAERPLRYGPVLQPDSNNPWEARGLTINQVLKDGDKYRAWGWTEDATGKRFDAYYESKDGLHWTRPVLKMVDYNGSRENNLVDFFPGSVFIDPTAPAEERYKCVAGDDLNMEQFRRFIEKHPDRWEPRALRKDVDRVLTGVQGFVSADGLTWRKLPEPFTVEHSDTQIIGAYNQTLKKYVIFTRHWFVGPLAADAPPDTRNTTWIGDSNGAGRRSIGYTESDRFGDFPLSRLIVTPRLDMKPSQLLYANCYTTFPGAPDQHLLFPSVWDTTTDTTHLEMLASHDGRTWNWVPGGPLMETQEFGEFDGGCIFWCPNLVELGNGDFALPYTGFEFPHKYPRGAWRFGWGYAVWPRGRLVAIDAAERGEFTTVSVMAPGRKLRINAVTKRAGEIRVAVTQRDGTPIPGRSFDDCTPIIGDQFRSPVQWKTTDDLGFADGQPICLKFKMTQARIYGLEFE